MCINFQLILFQGLQVTQELLDEVAEVSGVLTVGDDYLLPAVRAECERVIPEMVSNLAMLQTHFYSSKHITMNSQCNNHSNNVIQ